MKSFLLLVVFTGAVVASYPQHFKYKYYSEKDGLSNNVISCVMMDQQGFLWTGTHNGLNRFDGNAFEKFTNDPSDSNSIADNNIQKICSDLHHNLWIGTNAGISLYHYNTHTFSNYYPDTAVLPQPGISFQALADDDYGNIWVGAKNDLLIFDPVNKKFSSSGWARYAAVTVPVNGNHVRVIILSVIKKSRKELWILSTYGLYSVNTDTKEFSYYAYTRIPDYHGCELNYADTSGNVWIATYYAGILCFQSRSGTWVNYHTPPEFSKRDNANSILQYAGDTLMYCSTNSLLLFDARAGKVISKINCDTGETGLLKDAEYNAIVGADKLLWLGTSKGLVKITLSDSRLNFSPLAISESITKVFKVHDSGALLFTSINKNNTLLLKGEDNKTMPVINSDGALLHSTYQYFAEAPGGICYLNDDEHFYRYDLKTNTAINIPLPPKKYATNSFDIRNMVADRTGSVWIRTLSQGIMKYDIETKKLIITTEIPLDDNKELNALYYDSLTNTLWIAQEFNGVYRYDIEKKQVQHYGLNKPPSQRNAAIIYITGDNKGNVWLCDEQAGLVAYNYRMEKFTRYTTYDGLPSNNCIMGVYDDHGKFWFSSDIGLCQYDTLLKKFIGYTENEDFPVSPQAYLTTDRNGNIYMPYKNGYYAWNSEELKYPAKSGSLYLEDILLFNRHLPVDTAFHFSYEEKNIRVLFGLLSYDNRGKTIIEYSLNGGSWIAGDINSYISFANLAPGKYELTVRLKNESIPAIHTRFVIAQPFWQKWWFTTLVIIIAILSILFIIRSRLNTIRKESLLRQQVMESEMSALRSQMNPHFIFNTLNSINSYIIEKKQEEASDYLTDFSKLMRIILEYSRKRAITLQEELYTLKLYLELEWRRLEASFDYKIIVEPDVDSTAINIPPLIIQPYAENAIWHGLRSKKTDGHINIHIRNYKDGVLIVVEDNGVGRAAANKTEKVKNSHSFGTEATMQRILLNDPGSKIEIEDLYHADGQAMGTRVNIYLNQLNNQHGTNNH